MYIHDFDWDEKNENHIANHGVAVSEVEEAILFGSPLYQKSKKGKYVAYTVTGNGKHLFLVFVVKGSGQIRVISARNMEKKEKRYYKKRREAR